MNQQQYHPWLFKLALATAVATLPLMIVGGHVTTEGYGMAFPDWPTSDGENMLTYSWFDRAADKFYEHGHRLLGMLVGFLSIALVIVAFKVEDKKVDQKYLSARAGMRHYPRRSRRHPRYGKQ